MAECAQEFAITGNRKQVAIIQDCKRSTPVGTVGSDGLFADMIDIETQYDVTGCPEDRRNIGYESPVVVINRPDGTRASIVDGDENPCAEIAVLYSDPVTRK